jgi:hypothetical protein
VVISLENTSIYFDESLVTCTAMIRQLRTLKNSIVVIVLFSCIVLFHLFFQANHKSLKNWKKRIKNYFKYFCFCLCFQAKQPGVPFPALVGMVHI